MPIFVLIILGILVYIVISDMKNKVPDNFEIVPPSDVVPEVRQEKVTINEEKMILFNKIESSTKHFFITGKAGTGKSLLLQYLRQNTKKSVVVVAPTGVAAINVNGQTIHSLFRIPPSFIALNSLPFNRNAAEILRHLDMILIDEVSMVRADLMDAIDYRLRQSREDDKPFGGVQIVMFGDLYQLPPIVSDVELNKYFQDNHGGFNFFNANVWQLIDFEKHELQEVFRQKDQHFKNLLNEIRVGKNSPEIMNKINERFGLPLPKDRFIYLCSTNSKVNNINNKKLSEINSPEHVYIASISGEIDEKSYPADEVLRLKKGAQVMMLKNDFDKRWVNGTLGTIHSLSKDEIKVKVDGIIYTVSQTVWQKIKYNYNRNTKQIEEKPISSFTQYPIRLAWAVTIHKAQGKTFEKIVVDLDGGSFAAGQTYVALSRCTTFDGVFLTDKIYSQDIKVDPDVAKFMQ